MKNLKKTRKRDHNYNCVGSYFITICTHNRLCYFGEIQDDKISLSNLGKVALECWQEISRHNVNIEIDEFVIMPNHVYGIIHILPDDNDSLHDYVGKDHGLSLRKYSKPTNQKLPVVIRQYKSSVTRKIRNLYSNYEFKWQTSYYDMIIKSQKQLQSVRFYIENNIINWQDDTENPKLGNDIFNNYTNII